MGQASIIAGIPFRRRHLMNLSREERAVLDRDGCVEVRRRVEWPIPGRTAFLDRAWVDPGGTDLWGPGPYLKVPNVFENEDELVNRVFCPWGYPPDRVRGFRTSRQLEITSVTLVHSAGWDWVIRLNEREGGPP